jgi:hypothetical protein
MVAIHVLILSNTCCMEKVSINNKEKYILCLLNHHAMETYGEVEVQHPQHHST